MSKSHKMIHFPKTRLAKLVARGGGMSQSAALENAQKNIETMHAQGDEFILRLVAEIADIVGAPRPAGNVPEADLTAVLLRADQIVTLAETFDHEFLATIAKSLCDMVEGFLGKGLHDRAPILVHIQALVLMAPGTAKLSDVEFQIVLDQLTKVRRHFNILAAAEEETDTLCQLPDAV